LVGCFLELENLLVDELTFLVNDEVGIHWAGVHFFALFSDSGACSR
jgi:hypothetical protein